MPTLAWIPKMKNPGGWGQGILVPTALSLSPHYSDYSSRWFPTFRTACRFRFWHSAETLTREHDEVKSATQSYGWFPDLLSMGHTVGSTVQHRVFLLNYSRVGGTSSANGEGAVAWHFLLPVLSTANCGTALINSTGAQRVASTSFRGPGVVTKAYLYR